MGDLKNTFSWSFSAREDFDECRRRRYWAKYAMWGGWDPGAKPLQRKAYQLGKMHNRFSLLGNAVEHTLRKAIRHAQQGESRSVEELYPQYTRDYLNAAWKQSRDGLWQTNPKKYVCLFEHYYGADATDEQQKEWIAFISRQCRLCVENFIETVLPRLAGIRPEDEVTIAHVGSGGDPESFPLNGHKIYAIPDYVYRRGDAWFIHDWKAGKQKPHHRDQMLLYALWARTQHGVAPEQLTLLLEYLSFKESVRIEVSSDILEQTVETIQTSIDEMADYVVDGDLGRNVPLPQEDWDLAADPLTCRLCNFYELCKPELDDLAGGR
jgi:hypothetical protein